MTARHVPRLEVTRTEFPRRRPPSRLQSGRVATLAYPRSGGGGGFFEGGDAWRHDGNDGLT